MTEDYPGYEREVLFPDRLQQLFSEQQRIEAKRFGEVTLTTEGLRSMILACMMEVGECLDEMQWKPWKGATPDSPPEVNRNAMLEELADVFLFTIAITRRIDFSATDFYRAVKAKLAYNEGRLDHA